MDNFNLKKYLTEGRLINEETIHPSHDDGLSDLDKQYKNEDLDLTIFDEEEGKRDNSGPWATTAESSVMLYIMSREGERYSSEDIKNWTESVKGFKDSYMISRKVGEIFQLKPGEWAFELTTTVWQN